MRQGSKDIRSAARTTGARCAAVLLALGWLAVVVSNARSESYNPLRAERIPTFNTEIGGNRVVKAQRIAPARQINPPPSEPPSITYQSESWSPPREGGNEAALPDEEYFEESDWFGRVRPLARLRSWLPLAFGRPFAHGEPNDPDRYLGPGEPLVGTSWLNRPYSAGFFAGGIFGDEPFDSRVEQGGGFLGGIRAGYDFDHYTGAEFRVALSRLELYDTQDVPLGRAANYAFFDLNLLYYPWGDTRWRPYFSFGLGIAALNVFDEQGRNYNDALLLMPFGVGLKFYQYNWSAWRLDVLDNVAFGHGRLDTQHNLSISLGWELRYGAKPRLYFPAHPGVERW